MAIFVMKCVRSILLELYSLLTVFPLISAEPQISAAPLDIHIQISASPLISAAHLNMALIRTVTIFY